MKKYIVLILLVFLFSCNNIKNNNYNISNNYKDVENSLKCGEKEVCILSWIGGRYLRDLQGKINNQLEIDGKDYRVSFFWIWEEMKKSGYEIMEFINYNGYSNNGYSHYDMYKFYMENAKNFDIIQLVNQEILGEILIQENIFKPIPEEITDNFPSLLLEPFNYDNKFYGIPGANIYSSRKKIKANKPYYFVIVKKNLLENQNINLTSFINLLESDNGEYTVKDYVWALLYPPYLTPISTYGTSPFYVNEETKTVELIYENEVYKKIIEKLCSPQLSHRFYPVDMDETVADITVYSHNFDEENYVGIIEYPISALNIYTSGLFVVNHKNRNLGEEFFEYLLSSSDFVNESGDILGFSNLDLLTDENKANSLGKENFSYEQMAEFYSQNLSCAFGLKFDFTKFDKQELFLVSDVFNKHKIDVNALGAFDYDILVEKMNETKAKEICEELNIQLQKYLSGEKQ